MQHGVGVSGLHQLLDGVAAGAAGVYVEWKAVGLGKLDLAREGEVLGVLDRLLVPVRPVARPAGRQRDRGHTGAWPSTRNAHIVQPALANAHNGVGVAMQEVQGGVDALRRYVAGMEPDTRKNHAMLFGDTEHAGSILWRRADGHDGGEVGARGSLQHLAQVPVEFGRGQVCMHVHDARKSRRGGGHRGAGENGRKRESTSMAGTLRLVVTRQLPEAAQRQLEVLKGICLVQWPESDAPPPREWLEEQVPNAAGLMCLLTDRIDAPLLDKAGDGLRVVRGARALAGVP